MIVQIKISYPRKEECGIVLKGRLMVKTAKGDFILEEGDSMCFDSTIPPHYINLGMKVYFYMNRLHQAFRKPLNIYSNFIYNIIYNNKNYGI